MDRPLPLPQRIYEPNILHNPFTWMGVWTPQGWRVHHKRFGEAERLTITLSGDGKTTCFPGALLDTELRRIAWQDDLHLRDDAFTEGGIYPADPRVEHPPGRPRWAVSHTLMCYPVADHTLYTHEYTWDLVHGHLQTHFRRHVQCEEARTDSRDGMTVQVANRPISGVIEGNVHYSLPNSAVRGVWTNPQCSGQNLYTRDVVQLITMHNGVYAVAPHSPVVQCRGVWQTHPDDPLEQLFELATGLCRSRERLTEALAIPLDNPKLSQLPTPFERAPSKLYEGTAAVPSQPYGVIGREHLSALRERIGSSYAPGRVGYALNDHVDVDEQNYAGYEPCFDLNDDGIIDERDAQIMEANIGWRVRYNLYWHAYFGGDWLSISTCLDAQHRPGAAAIADYTFGAGYDAQTGVIRLFETPGPNQQVWVEYHYDAPAEPGENNIRVHFYRER